jgi:hypothetical protein
MRQLKYRIKVRGKQVWTGNDDLVANQRFRELCTGKPPHDPENQAGLYRLQRHSSGFVDESTRGRDYILQAWGDAK